MTTQRREARTTVREDRPSRKTETTEMGTIEGRPDRVPLVNARSILDGKGLDPDYVYHWFHNTERNTTRVDDAVRAGYEFVTRDEGLKIGVATVNASDSVESKVTRQVGRGQLSYLMKLPKELHLEDLKLKRERVTDPLIEYEKTRREFQEKTNTRKGGFGELKIEN